MASADGRNFVSNRLQERSPVGAGDDDGSVKTVLSAAFASYVSYILGPQIFVLPSILPKAMTIEMIMSMVLNRFGICLGFGEKTVKEVCAEQQIDTDTFLCVANYICGRGDFIFENEEDTADTDEDKAKPSRLIVATYHQNFRFIPSPESQYMR